MTFQPFVLGSGLPAWSFLKSTLLTQKASFERNRPLQSDSQYFLERFDHLNSADDIVSDRRILRVVLGAYGLADDINNKFFIKSVLSGGVNSDTALANRLTDRRYRALATDFDFSRNSPSHKSSKGLKSKVISHFFDQSFEIELGRTAPDMRLSL